MAGSILPPGLQARLRQRGLTHKAIRAINSVCRRRPFWSAPKSFRRHRERREAIQLRRELMALPGRHHTSGFSSAVPGWRRRFAPRRRGGEGRGVRRGPAGPELINRTVYERRCRRRCRRTIGVDRSARDSEALLVAAGSVRPGIADTDRDAGARPGRGLHQDRAVHRRADR